MADPLRFHARQGATWEDVALLLATMPAGGEVFVARGELPAPSDAGASLSVGLPRGQLADWRFPPRADCVGLHVHELEDGWRAHLDRVHPACGVVQHLQADAPAVLLLAGPLVGVLVGALGRRPGLGLVAGLVVGVLLVQRRP